MSSKIHDMFDKEANRLSSAEDEIAETLEFGKMQDPYDHAPDSDTSIRRGSLYGALLLCQARSSAGPGDLQRLPHAVLLPALTKTEAVRIRSWAVVHHS